MMQQLSRISKKTLVGGIAILLLLTSCSEKTDPTLHEAARIHNDVLKLMKKLESQIDIMEFQSHLPPDSTRSWRILLDDYSQQLIEVPGNETHQHHHHDGVPAELTSNQILLIQQEVQISVQALKSRIEGNVKQ